MTKYSIAAGVAGQLRETLDYTVDRKLKSADLTERGMMVAEQLLGVADIWDTYDPWGGTSSSRSKPRRCTFATCTTSSGRVR